MTARARHFNLISALLSLRGSDPTRACWFGRMVAAED
jgi:replication-associated recombination protein RarA